MSKTTNISIRIDENLKKQAEELFSDLGLNMSTALNIFLRQSVRYGGIPFEISTRNDAFYNKYNQKILEKSIDQLKTGKGIVHDPIGDYND